MNLSIDLINQFLANEYVRIPFLYRQQNETSFTFSVNASEIYLHKLPVNHYKGDVIIPECFANNLYIPETLTTAESGFALVEVHNKTDENITITLDQPLEVIPFPDSEKENFDFFHAESFVPPHNTDKIENIENLIRTEHLNEEERKSIISICCKFSDIFYRDNEPLTFTNQIKHEIKTTYEIPVYTRPYRYPFVHKAEVQKQISKMLNDGIIRPSQSPWSSPIWIVPKKIDASGKQKWRIVIDYRKVNEKTIDDRYPLPNITDILDKLGKCQYFSTLDLASGFHQIEMDPKSIPKTAFNVENGHFEFTRMPYELKNSPATLQRVMDNVLKDLQRKICFVYMDDIIIFSTSLQEHIANLKLVFQKLRECKFKIQLDKSEFLRKDVEFLGHVITPQGIKPNPKKIHAIQNFPIPRTVKEIKSFLGLLGYYRRFIKNFAKITKPFTKCLKKGEKIEHNDEFKKAFSLCKTILCNDPILQYPDFEKPFNLTTDASNVAIGAILSQGTIGKDLPVAYASRTLNPAETNYSTIEKELLAVVWAVKYFRPYLFGRKFEIVTDHKPLQWLFNIKDPDSRLVRWKLKLLEYDYEIVYKKGKQNTNADALSRIELNAVENESVIVNIGDADEIIEQYINNPELIPVPHDPTLIRECFDKNPRGQEVPKINIISNIQIKPPDENIEDLLTKQQDRPAEDDNETVHSNLEDPILEIPITQKPLNTYKNQIYIVTSQNSISLNVKQQKIFDNNRWRITIPTNDTEKHILNIFREYISPKTPYAIYAKPLTIMPLLVVTVQKYFKNSSYRLVQTNQLLTDVTDPEEQEQYLQYHHVGKTCHKGINEMKASLSKTYYWPNMIKDITNYVNSCNTCQKAKYDRNPPALKFNLTPTSKKPFEHIHIDTFQISNKTFLTILDSFSRYGQAYPIKSLQNTNIVDNLLIFISHHGLPAKITTDRGTEFKNNVLEDFCKLHRIELHFTTSKNSNSNSPVERLHSTLAEEIRCLKLDKPHEDVDTLMKYAILGYNNAIHSVTNFTPFQVVKGHIDSNDPFELTDTLVLSQYIQDHKERTKTLYDQIKNKNSEVKRKIISDLNKDREDPVKYGTNETAYIQTKSRGKALPKFVASEIIKDDDKKLITKKGTYHKSIVKKPRNFYGKPLLQDDSSSERRNDNPPGNDSGPSSSR